MYVMVARFVGWIVVGALIRRYSPLILSRLSERGWLANLLAGFALAFVEREAVARRTQTKSQVVFNGLRGRRG